MTNASKNHVSIQIHTQTQNEKETKMSMNELGNKTNRFSTRIPIYLLCTHYPMAAGPLVVHLSDEKLFLGKNDLHWTQLSE